jgi:DNA invertase Pin-like site-specific DNA recombinase
MRSASVALGQSLRRAAQADQLQIATLGLVTRTRVEGLEAARRQGRVGGRRPVVDDDKRAAILARRGRGESIRVIAAGVKVSIGVVHKTLTDARQEQQP